MFADYEKYAPWYAECSGCKASLGGKSMKDLHEFMVADLLSRDTPIYICKKNGCLESIKDKLPKGLTLIIRYPLD